MPRRPHITLTYANVTATLALFIALGGSSWAAPARQSAVKLITGKQIKNGTVGEVDLSPVVRAKLLKAGTAGPAGAKGDTGAAGPQGAKGEVGPTGAKGDAGSDATFAGAAAGGALAGTYPAPSLAPGAVSTASIATGAVTGLQIANNTITGTNIINGTLGKNDVGTTFTTNIDLPSLASGACTNFSFTTPSGLGNNPVATVNAPGNFFSTLGLVYNWDIGITDGDTVDVHVCNVSGAAINPANGAWRALVFGN